MPRCAFLTMDNLDEFEVYDDLLLEPLSKFGWSVDMVSWRNRKARWDQYEAVIIRSPWDYQQDAELFMHVLEEIDRSPALLENPLELVTWNIDKIYLRELQEKGVLIVPTLWSKNFHIRDLESAFEKLNTCELVIKPTVSANADNTFWLDRQSLSKKADELVEVFSSRPFMIQPFMENIVSEGEFSLFYFGGEYSHTILKTPAKGDFRVQEEHGGILASADPEKKLLQRAEQTMQFLEPQPLYARADYVRTEDNDFALMELELIEPSLYFNMDPESPERFARIFDHWMKKKKNSL
ncbi:hypothetical protein G3570_06360 [Balneolaceae bacterium YR4-1]|uniref:Prokaryotic glutathione synthetase ATP-binding domain-containing protein n=1 Tax=Halalkalibaculum roseum TaxID=2709311 RepID=A0A6M1T0G5_9BACT|nr:hypothetical protein [Halalkalibaculum roseum]NGP76247.1 hypothetical protein [Halalkalibaculum roseum]